jgi:hypothetical protein
MGMCGVLGILVIAVFLGAIVTEVFLDRLRRWQRLYPKLDDDPDTRAVPPWFMGFIERVVFSLLVWWVGLTGATITAMFAWLALKMATNWTRPRDGSDRAQAKVIRLSQGALLAGVISLMFAAWGGLVARGEALPCAHSVLSPRIASTVAPKGELSAKQLRSLSFRARQSYRGPRVHVISGATRCKRHLPQRSPYAR